MSRLDLEKNRYLMAGKNLPKEGNRGLLPLPGQSGWRLPDNENWFGMFVVVSHVTEDTGHKQLLGIYQEWAQARIGQTPDEIKAEWANAECIRKALEDNRQVETTLIEVLINEQSLQCFIASSSANDLGGKNGVIEQLYKAGIEIREDLPWEGLGYPPTFYDNYLDGHQHIAGALFLETAIQKQALRLAGKVKLVRWDGEGIAHLTLSKSVGAEYDQVVRIGALVLSAKVWHGRDIYVFDALNWKLSSASFHEEGGEVSPSERVMFRLGRVLEITHELANLFNQYLEAGLLNRINQELDEATINAFQGIRDVYGDVVEPVSMGAFLQEIELAESTPLVYQSWLARQPREEEPESNIEKNLRQLRDAGKKTGTKMTVEFGGKRATL